MNELQRLKDICLKNGICTECGQHWEHHLDEPFASCGCGTGEDTTLNSPYMQLQKRFYDYRCSNKLTEEELQQLAEDILCDIDYDIYKEEMSDGFGLIDGIKSKIIDFVENVEVVYE